MFSGTQVLHLLPDFGGGTGHQGSPEGLVSLLSHVAVGGTNTADAVLVVFEAEGCIVEKGVDKGLMAAVEHWKSASALSTGFRMARTPCLTPSERSLYKLLSMGSGQPRTARRNWVRRAASTGARRGPMSGTTWQIYCHSARRQKTRPAYAV